MKQKAIEAARFLSAIRLECRILNGQNLPLTGKENDFLRDAIDCLVSFSIKAEIPNVNTESKSE